MKHEMKIRHNPFIKIKSKTKTIEMRLFDEKRSKISAGDIIVFTDISNEDELNCRVLNLYKYHSFDELYEHHDKVSIGYNENEEACAKDMNKYYSVEMVKKYGVVGIEIEPI